MGKAYFAFFLFAVSPFRHFPSFLIRHFPFFYSALGSAILVMLCVKRVAEQP